MIAAEAFSWFLNLELWEAGVVVCGLAIMWRAIGELTADLYRTVRGVAKRDRRSPKRKRGKR
jgi:hypothetical protein